MLGFKRQKTFLMLTKKIEETTKILVVEDASFQQKKSSLVASSNKQKIFHRQKQKNVFMTIFIKTWQKYLVSFFSVEVRLERAWLLLALSPLWYLASSHLDGANQPYLDKNN